MGLFSTEIRNELSQYTSLDNLIVWMAEIDQSSEMEAAAWLIKDDNFANMEWRTLFDYTVKNNPFIDLVRLQLRHISRHGVQKSSPEGSVYNGSIIISIQHALFHIEVICGLPLYTFEKKDPTPIDPSNIIFREDIYGIYDPQAIAKQGSSENRPITESKPLHTKERETLLIIVAALCKKAGIDYSGRGAATEITRATEAIGASIDDGTVRNHLSKIQDTLDKKLK